MAVAPHTRISPPTKKWLPDWSSLPCGPLEVISRRLETIFDYVRFRSVCTSWRSAAPKRPQFPWLLMEYIDQTEQKYLELYDFPDTEKLYTTPLLEELGGGPYISGSALGWFFFVDDGLRISLLNPFTGGLIRLPRHTNFTSGLVNLVLSSHPTRPDCQVMVYCTLGSSMMLHCRIGDSSWAELEKPFRCNNVVFYKGMFYAAVYNYRVFVCEVGDDRRVREVLPANTLFSDGKTRGERLTKTYLVVSSGDLLLVGITYKDCECGNVGCHECEAIKFEVFRVDLEFGQLRLFKMENLGGRALYLCSESMALSAGSSPWCEGNCIYFINNDTGDTYDITIFNMEEGEITSFRMNWRPVHWFTPSLC